MGAVQDKCDPNGYLDQHLNCPPGANHLNNTADSDLSVSTVSVDFSSASSPYYRRSSIDSQEDGLSASASFDLDAGSSDAKKNAEKLQQQQQQQQLQSLQNGSSVPPINNNNNGVGGGGPLNFRRPVPGMSAVVSPSSGNQQQAAASPPSWANSGDSDDNYTVPLAPQHHQFPARQRLHHDQQDAMSPGILHHQVQVHHSGGAGQRSAASSGNVVDALSYPMAAMNLSRRTMSQSPAPHQSSNASSSSANNSGILHYGSAVTSPLASRIHCPSPLGDPCSSCYSSDERGSNKPNHHGGPVCSSTPTPQHHGLHQQRPNYWHGANGNGNGGGVSVKGGPNVSPGGGSSNSGGGRTSPSDLGYHTLVTRGAGSSSSGIADVGLPLGLNLTHGLNTPLPNLANSDQGISPWSTETCVRNMPPPVVPRGSTSGNNYHPITLTMSMMDPPVGAHRPAPPTPPGLEISALSGTGGAFDVSGSSLDHHHHHHFLHNSSSSSSAVASPSHLRRPVFGGGTNKLKRVGGHHRQSGKQTAAVSPFDLVSDDLILKIFSYLSTQELCSCARVSRRFYHLAWDPKLWTAISLNSETSNPDRALKAVLRLLSRGDGGNGLANGNAPAPASEVEKIVLSGCSKLTDRSIAAISRKCPRLRHLEVRNCPGLSDQALVHLAHRCHDLEHLDFSGCSQITCLSLQYLDGLVSAGNGGGKMRSLPSPGSGSQSESQLDSSSSASPSPLSLPGAGGIPPPPPLLPPPPPLQLLLQPQPPKRMCLQYLDLTDCHMLEDQGLTTIVSVCTQLLYLYLRRCVRITDVGVKAVASYCLLLREFSVSDCVHVTDLSLYKLSTLGPNLRYLSVAKCEQVTDAGLTQIARRCYKLRYLNVRGCEAITDAVLEVLSRSCPRLRALDIGKCDVTDRGLRFLSQYCPNLKKLSLKSCDVITNKGIQYIAYYCRGLQQLNIQDTCITVDGYRAVKKFCKRCIIEHTNPAFY